MNEANYTNWKKYSERVMCLLVDLKRRKIYYSDLSEEETIVIFHKNNYLTKDNFWVIFSNSFVSSHNEIAVSATEETIE